MNPEELQDIQQQQRQAQQQFHHRLNVCAAASCLSRGSDTIRQSLSEAIETQGKSDSCCVRGVGCMGLCSAGPLVEVRNPRAESDGQASEVMYREVEASDAEEIVGQLGDRGVQRLKLSTKIPFFLRQERVVLENSGRIDPESIEDYIANSGYEALVHALTEMEPQEVIREVSDSGLRGRGGAGFPVGLKWSTVAKTVGDQKFVICNADEGDPGAFMDRAVLESDPHRVIEGMAIAGHAVGASHGYIYVRAEYPLAIDRLKMAIRQAKRIGLLGHDLCDTEFSFNVEIRLGAGAFVCGEETALIASIEGKRGLPRPRPPFPASFGLFGKPTLINNVETLANIPVIIRRGGAWLSEIGTQQSKGTKVFALAGEINNNGLIEVPMGITLREIIFEMGNGIPEGKKFKAVQTGGPSGGCMPEQCLDMPVDYESLLDAGSIMGSGGMVVMDETSNMVDVARFFMDFCKDESCGKCVPCRVGTHQMLELLDRICRGQGSDQDLELLKELCEVVQHSSLCGLGQTAPNPVLSTLRYFENEYFDLIRGDPKETEDLVTVQTDIKKR